MAIAEIEPAPTISRITLVARPRDAQRIDSERISLIEKIQSLIHGYVPREDLSIEELQECARWCESAEEY